MSKEQVVEEPFVEFLSPEDTPEDQVADLAPLKFETPLEQFKNLFHRMADIRAKVILWESKTVITNPKTRDEAIRLRTMVTKTSKMIDDVRMDLVKPAQEYIKQVKEYADEARYALTAGGTGDTNGVAGRLTKKITAYAEECLRLEKEIKAKAEADLKRTQDEIEAWEMEAQMKEQRLRAEEDLRLQQIHDQAVADAQAKGHTETDEMVGDIAMNEEMARIEAERAERTRKEEDQKIANQRVLDEAQSKMVGRMAVGTGAGKVKGVKEIWVIEELEGKEDLLPRNVLSFDMTKARKWVDGGFSKSKEPLEIIPGCRVYKALGKGGK